jgi:DNA polymerase-3 subunit delta
MSDSAAARVHLFYGDDQPEINDQTQALAAAVSADETLRSMNVNRLTGKEATLDALKGSAYAMPFLADRRVVLVVNPQETWRAKDTRSQWLGFLDGLPESTQLAVLVYDEYGGKRDGWKVMNHNGKFLLEWAAQAGASAAVHLCSLPQPYEMPKWIQEQTRKMGGRCEAQAAAALAGLIGADTGVARQEISKLLAYVNYARPIEAEDVQEIAAAGNQSNVFEMVDALGQGRTNVALRQLDGLLQNGDPYSLFGMVVRQFRLLLLTREQLAYGRLDAATLAKRLSINSFVAEKLLAQAPRYSLTKLETIYRGLLDVDMMMKTGQSEPVVALQTFIISLNAA